MRGSGAEGGDRPPLSALLNTLRGRDDQRGRGLGEYTSASYPGELLDVVRRRTDVVQDLLGMDVVEPAARVAAIPRLRQLLGRYPHPLVYEALILACIEARRYDEAQGVAFAARQRRKECAASELPEVRSEIEGLREWTRADIDDFRIGRR